MFPHQAQELQQYSEYTLQFFRAFLYSYVKVINLDKAICQFVGEVKHIELSEFGQFRHVEAPKTMALETTAPPLKRKRSQILTTGWMKHVTSGTAESATGKPLNAITDICAPTVKGSTHKWNVQRRIETSMEYMCPKFVWDLVWGAISNDISPAAQYSLSADPLPPQFELKAEHKCTYGWPGSVPVGLNSFRTQAQICAGHQTQVTWIHRSSACQNAGTGPQIWVMQVFQDIHKSSQLFIYISTKK
jgi:hypothetical protein